MIHTYVNSRLVMWSEWVLKREAGSLGYPRECPYTRLMQRSGGAGFKPDLDSDAMEIDKILTDLKKSDPKIFRVTHLFYGIEFKSGKVVPMSMTKEMIAKDLGIHRDTVYNHLDKAHRLILDGLHERDPIAHIR